MLPERMEPLGYASLTRIDLLTSANEAHYNRQGKRIRVVSCKNVS